MGKILNARFPVISEGRGDEVNSWRSRVCRSGGNSELPVYKKFVIIYAPR